MSHDTAANGNGAAPQPSREAELAKLVGPDMHPQYAGKLPGWITGNVTVDAARNEIMALYRDGQPQVRTATGPTTGGVAIPREAEKPFASASEQLEAVIRYGRGERLHPRLGHVNTNAYRLDAAVSGMNEGVGPDGGFFIEPQLAPGLIEPIYDEDPFLSRVQRLTLSTNATSIRLNIVDETSRATGSRWGGVRAYWAGEADTVTASKPKLRALQVDVNKLMAIAYQTEELANDAPAMAQLAARAFPAEMRFVLTEAVWRGTGAGQPKGWLASGAQYEQAIEATQTIANSNTFIALNLSKMRMRMPAGLLGDAVYLYQPELLPTFISATLAAATVPIWMQGMSLAAAPQETLIGRPAYGSEFSEAVGTVGDLVFVAPSQYLVVEKGGINYATSLHVRFLNDEQTFRWTYRVGGAPLWHTPHTPFKGTASSKSPFVTLGARS